MEADVLKLRAEGNWPQSNPAVPSPTRPVWSDDRPVSPEPFDFQSNYQSNSSEQINENAEDIENTAAMANSEVCT